MAKRSFRMSLALIGLILASLACLTPQVDFQVIPDTGSDQTLPSGRNSATLVAPTLDPQRLATQQAIPTLAAPAPQITPPAEIAPGLPSSSLADLHDQLTPGVVNIQVLMRSGGQVGQGAGSGFVLDDSGHIVTNNHVVSGASQIIVVFSNKIEMEAELIGVDPDSDLAVVKVAALPEGVHALPLGDSDAVRVGEWVIAIGNPFGLGGSMSVGIVSAVGRTIASGVTPFSIPQAIQTDAAINPGNSGGPLLNLAGQVIGVNAQIATQGTNANAGVGFAIPANVVRKVAPALIANGGYQWAWLGVTGAPVNLAVMQANRLDTQMGAYIDEVVSGGPADQAGLRGSSGSAEVGGIPTPTGGDVIVAVDGKPISDFNDLMIATSQHNPGDTLTLTVLRGGQRLELPLTLQARPQNFTSSANFPQP